MSAKERKSTPPNNGSTEPLTSLLASVDRFTEGITAQIVAAAGEGEDHLIIQSTGESFVAQTRRLTDFIREAALGIAPAQRQDLNVFLRVQDGEALVERALNVSAQVLSPGGGPVTLGFLDWIDEVMHALKKIIFAIWDIIFHTKPPDWLVDILNLIDELLNLLKDLFGTRLGFRSSQLADEFSRREVNFLREMAAVASLRAARMSGRAMEDEGSA
jgi:hypothetical protein